jgi:MFS family permease
MGDASVLRNRRFLILWSGNGLTMAGSAAVKVAYPILALTVSGSPAAAGWTAVATGIPALLFQVPAGLLADYVNRRRTMLVCQAAGLAATTAAAAAVLTRPSFLLYVLLAAAFAESTAFVVFELAEFGAIRDVVSTEQRPVAYSFQAAEQPIANMSGRTLGGGLLSLGAAIPFLANAISYVGCMLALTRLPARLLDPVPSRQRLRHGITEGFRWVWRVPFIRWTALTAGLTNAVFQGVIVLVIVVLTEHRQPAWSIGAVLAATGAGGVLGSFAAPRLVRRFRAERVYLGALWGWTAALLLIAAFTSPYTLALGWAGVGWIGAVGSVAMTVVRLRVVPEATLGRMLGAASLVIDGAGPLGGLAIGYALTAYGTLVSGWSLAAVMLLIALLGTVVIANSGAATGHPRMPATDATT